MRHLLPLLALLVVIPGALAFDFGLPTSTTFAEDGSTSMDLVTLGYLNLSTGESITSYTFTGNTNAIVTASGNVLTFSAKANWNGAETVTVNATNNTGTSKTDTISIIVTAVNDAPVLNVSSSLKGYVDTPFTLQLSATDPDVGASFTYNASTDWTTFSVTSSGLISFTPTIDDYGLHKVTITAIDNTGLTNSKTVSFLVTDTTDDGALIFSDGPDVEDLTGDDSELVPGDSIEVTFELENKLAIDINNVEAKAWIEDSSGKKVVDTVTLDKFDLSDGDTQDGKLTLKIPVDTDEDNLYLFVRAEGDDDNDATRSVLKVEELQLERPDNAIAFDSVTISPDPAVCGQSLDIRVDIWNVGTEEQEVKLHVTNSDLGIDIYSDLFDLDNSGDDRESVQTIPVMLANSVKPGNHTLDISANYNSGKTTESYDAVIDVVCSGYVAGEDEGDEGAGALTLDDTTLEGKQGQQVKFTATLKNTGTTAAAYTFELSGISDWASGYVEPDTVTLAGGAETDVFIYVTPKTSASGEQTATLTVKSGTTTLESETLTVSLPERPTLSLTSLGTLPTIDNTAALVIIVGVLVVVALVIVGRKRATSELKVYGKKRGRKAEDEEE